MNQQSINKTLICFNQLGIVFKETRRVLCWICNSIIAMPPCGHIWNKRFERPLDCRYFQIQTDDFYQSWSEHFSTWTAALVRYRGAFPGDDSAFWRTFLSLRERELGTIRHRSAATARRHDNSRSESRWVICMKRKVHLRIPQRLSFSASHTINGREWMWPHILNFLSHRPPANRTHISFLNVQKVKRWNIRS